MGLVFFRLGFLSWNMHATTEYLYFIYSIPIRNWSLIVETPTFTPALKPQFRLSAPSLLSLCSLVALPMFPRCSLVLSLAPLLLPFSPFVPPRYSFTPSYYGNFKRPTPLSSYWVLIKEEPVMAPLNSHHILLRPFSVSLSLHCLFPAVSRQCTKRIIANVLISYQIYLDLRNPSVSAW